MLLDEPTNHLDVYTREALEEALEVFTGALIVVSHDRYFIDRVAENILLVEDGAADIYYGNYSDLVEKMKSGDVVPVVHEAVAPVPPPKPAAQAPPPPSLNAKADRAEQKKRDKRVKKIEEEIVAIEARIAAAEGERERNDLLLCSEEVYRDGERTKKIQARNADLKAMIDLLYGKWETLSKEKEEAETEVTRVE